MTFYVTHSHRDSFTEHFIRSYPHGDGNMRASDKLALLKRSDYESFGTAGRFGRLPEAATLGCPLPAPFSPPIQIAIVKLYDQNAQDLPDPRFIWTHGSDNAVWPQAVRGFA